MNLDLFRSLANGTASDLQMLGAFLVCASIIGGALWIADERMKSRSPRCPDRN